MVVLVDVVFVDEGLGGLLRIRVGVSSDNSLLALDVDVDLEDLSTSSTWRLATD